MNGHRISFAFMNIEIGNARASDFIFDDYEPRMMYLPITKADVSSGFSRFGAM